MDPALISLITTAAVAGSATIGTEIIKESTKDMYHRFMTLLRGKASNNREAHEALTKADDPAEVYRAVQGVKADTDPEIIHMARELAATLPQSQVERAQRVVIQQAKLIQNIERVENMNIDL